LEAKNNIPVTVNSIYELSYVSLGRPGIFIVSFVQFIMSIGLDMIYFIVFGDAAASIVFSLTGKENFWSSRILYILILAGLLVIPLLQKELKEIKMVSVVLFLSIGLFLVLMMLQLIMDGSALNPDEDRSIYYRVHWNLKLMTAFGIILTAYGFQQNLFPIYQSLAIKTTGETLKATGWGLIMAYFLYVMTGILALYVFGTGISSSVMNNIDIETTWSSYIIRVSFMIVLACHIPYIFFSGKESMLIIIDEIRRKSMSYALDHTLQQAVIN